MKNMKGLFVKQNYLAKYIHTLVICGIPFTVDGTDIKNDAWLSVPNEFFPRLQKIAVEIESESPLKGVK